jgi:ubiquitin-protein ligase
MQQNPRLVKILAAQIRKAITQGNPNLSYAVHENDMQTIFCRFSGLADNYFGGQYFFKLVVPNDFPNSPPSFIFLTPNGIFDIGGKICISIGEFHASANIQGRTDNTHGAAGWRRGLGIPGFAVNCLSAFIVPEGLSGIRIKKESATKVQNYAKASIDYNIKYHKHIVDLFEEHDATNTDSPAVVLLRQLLVANKIESSEIPTSSDYSEHYQSMYGNTWKELELAVVGASKCNLDFIFPVLRRLAWPRTDLENVEASLRASILLIGNFEGPLHQEHLDRFLNSINLACLSCDINKEKNVALVFRRSTLSFAKFNDQYRTMIDYFLADDIKEKERMGNSFY